MKIVILLLIIALIVIIGIVANWEILGKFFLPVEEPLPVEPAVEEPVAEAPVEEEIVEEAPEEEVFEEPVEEEVEEPPLPPLPSPQPVCGNDFCEAGENLESCPKDCWRCGDGTCTSPYESYETCPQDCPFPVEPKAVISVSPSSLSVAMDENFTVAISISTAEEIYAFQLDLLFDPNVLSTTKADVVEGNFLKKDGASTFPVIQLEDGTLTIAFTRFGVQTGVSGTGTLVTITFKAIGVGTTALNLDNVKVVDPNVNSVEPVSVNDGTVQVI
jgi:hypothetical protein